MRPGQPVPWSGRPARRPVPLGDSPAVSLSPRMHVNSAGAGRTPPTNPAGGR